jgi:hypothetical protein
MGPLGAQLHLAMLLQGVDYNRGSGIVLLNGGMTDADIDFTVDPFDRARERLGKDGLLPS